MKRFHMSKNGYMVESPKRRDLEAIRKQDSRFKGAHIREILQLRPGAVEPCIVYQID